MLGILLRSFLLIRKPLDTKAGATEPPAFIGLPDTA